MGLPLCPLEPAEQYLLAGNGNVEFGTATTLAQSAPVAPYWSAPLQDMSIELAS